MESIFRKILEFEDSVDTSTPVVAVTDGEITIEKGQGYKGFFIVDNISDGAMYIVPTSIHGIIGFNKAYYKGKKVKIEYSIDQNLSIGRYNEEVIFIYNGGELILPVIINVIEKAMRDNCENQIEDGRGHNCIDFIINRLSYHPQDVGSIRIINHYDQPIEVCFSTKSEYVTIPETIKVEKESLIKFEVNISKKDMMFGNVPLKTSPKVESGISIKYWAMGIENTKEIIISFTSLSAMQSNKSVSCYKELLRLRAESTRLYTKGLIEKGKIDYGKLIEHIKIEINYDYTNIVNRLIYIYLSIIMKDYESANEEIKNLKKYSIFFDIKGQDIDTVLICFIGIMNGEDVRPIVSQWQVGRDDIWWKIVLKNRILKSNRVLYMEYKSLYELGVDNAITRAEIICFLNSAPFIPNKQDDYFKKLLFFAANKRYLSPKFIKQLENQHNSLIANDNVDVIVCEKIYAGSKNRSGLKLLCLAYMANAVYNDQSRQIFEKALEDKIIITELSKHYIMACYYSKKEINLKYIRITINKNSLEKACYDYLLYSILLKQGSHRNLMVFFGRDIANFNLSVHKMRTYYHPVNQEEVDNLANFIIQKQEYDLIEYGLQHGLISGVQLLLKSNVLDEKTVVNLIFKSLFMNQIDGEMIELFITHIHYFEKANQLRIILERISRAILLDDYSVDYRLIDVLEKFIEGESNRGIELALLRVYSKNVINDEIAKPLLLKYINDDIILPWFAELIEALNIDYQSRHECYFEYTSHKKNIVYFVYRIDEEPDFVTVKMRHITQGIFISRVTLFYNEKMQYYIKEMTKDGKLDIQVSDVYINNRVEETDDIIDKYDVINTILAAKEMEDEESINQEIEKYFELRKIEDEEMKLL